MLSCLQSQLPNPILTSIPTLTVTLDSRCADTEESLHALPELVKLNVNGCISLTRLVLKSCTKLEWLDCSGCALLHHVQAFSSALSHVRAVACQRLVVSIPLLLLLLLLFGFCCCCCCAFAAISGCWEFSLLML